MDAQSLAQRARALPQSQRASFLDCECPDPLLRARVDALLVDMDGAARVGDATEDLLSNTQSMAASRPTQRPIRTQADGETDIFDEITPRPLPMVGKAQLDKVIADRYTLLRMIGEGGMGAVYLAEQSEPVKRQVALKLIKSGLDSKTMLARFDAERQALALMDHPNIARIFDGGVTEGSLPYFVMEWVDGVPLTEYCDRHRLTVEERLRLFVQVCYAVQHAHQKGIIHRDLKPGNVLVSEVDGRPHPKVIDFGVAKAIEYRLTDMSLHDEDAIVGTPAYMSPEQSDPTKVDIDTRTDVYSLGVILYELFTGSQPIDTSQLKRGAVLEMLRMIREVEPISPCARLSSIDELASVAANRKTEPGQLSRLLHGELDWVVMKALEKDRDRRYATALGFAQDIERYLANEVVQARPVSRAYRVKKFIQRHRLETIAACLVGVSLVAGVVGTSVGMFQARAYAALAADEAKLKDLAWKSERIRAEAEAAANTKAQERLQDVVQANEVLSSIFLTLNPNEVQKDDKELRSRLLENLQRAAEQMKEAAKGDPALRAHTQMKLGVSMIALGSPATAIPLLESARDVFVRVAGPEDEQTLRCESNIAQALSSDGRLQESVASYEALLPRIRSALGEKHPMTQIAMQNLGAAYKDMKDFKKGLPLLEESLEMCRADPDGQDADLLMCLNNLASGYQDANRPAKAKPLFEEAYALAKSKLGENHLRTLVILNNLSGIYAAAGNKEKALKTSQEALVGLKSALGDEHPTTLLTINNVANYLKDLNRLDEALPMMEEIYQVQSAQAGPNHPLTINFLMNLAGAQLQKGNAAAGLPMLRDAAARRLESLGPDNDLTEGQIVGFLKACKRFETFDGALSLLEETLRRCNENPGRDHPRTMGYLTVYASICNDLKRPDVGVPILEEILAIRRDSLGENHPLTWQAMGNLGTGYWRMKKFEKSIPLFEELLDLQIKKYNRKHETSLMTIGNLGVNYRDAGRYDEAWPLLKEAYEASDRIPALSTVVWDLMACYHRAGLRQEFDALLEEGIASIEVSTPESSPQRAAALAQLGMRLLEEKNWVPAETQLRACLEIRSRIQPEEWNTFNTMSMLGAALAGQDKREEAESYLLQGYEGMKERKGQIPPQAASRIPESLDRLIEYYQSQNDTLQTESYRKLRAEFGS